ncbi:MAG: hypothetical protein U0746_17925 [Gemmataceae bacterium]
MTAKVPLLDPEKRPFEDTCLGLSRRVQIPGQKSLGLGAGIATACGLSGDQQGSLIVWPSFEGRGEFPPSCDGIVACKSIFRGTQSHRWANHAVRNTDAQTSHSNYANRPDKQMAANRLFW